MGSILLLHVTSNILSDRLRTLEMGEPLPGYEAMKDQLEMELAYELAAIQLGGEDDYLDQSMDASNVKFFVFVYDIKAEQIANCQIYSVCESPVMMCCCVT